MKAGSVLDWKFCDPELMLYSDRASYGEGGNQVNGIEMVEQST